MANAHFAGASHAGSSAGLTGGGRHHLEGSLEAATGWLSRSSRLSGLFMDEEYSSPEPPTTAAGGAHNGLPHSGQPPASPFQGVVPAGGAAGGFSSAGFGGTGHDLGGVLSALLIALLSGKFLWYARAFLRPNSVFLQIVNQPD